MANIIWQGVFSFKMPTSEFYSRCTKFYHNIRRLNKREQPPQWWIDKVKQATLYGNERLFTVQENKISLNENETVRRIIRMGIATDLVSSSLVNVKELSADLNKKHNEYINYTKLAECAQRTLLLCSNDNKKHEQHSTEATSEINQDIGCRHFRARSMIQYKTDLNKLESVILNIKTKIETEKNKIHLQYKKQQSDIYPLQEKNDKLTKDLNEMKKTQQYTVTLMNQIQEENQQLKSQKIKADEQAWKILDEQKNDKEYFRKEIQKLQDINKQLNNDNKAIQNQKQRLNQRLNHKVQRLQNEIKQLQNKQQQQNKLNEETKKLKYENESLKKHIQQTKKQLQQTKEQLQQKTQQVQHKTQQLQETTEQLEKTAQRLQQATQRLQQKTNEINWYKYKYNQSEEIISELYQKIEEMQQKHYYDQQRYKRYKNNQHNNNNNSNNNYNHNENNNNNNSNNNYNHNENNNNNNSNNNYNHNENNNNKYNYHHQQHYNQYENNEHQNNQQQYDNQNKHSYQYNHHQYNHNEYKNDSSDSQKEYKYSDTSDEEYYYSDTPPPRQSPPRSPPQSKSSSKSSKSPSPPSPEELRAQEISNEFNKLKMNKENVIWTSNVYSPIAQFMIFLVEYNYNPDYYIRPIQWICNKKGMKQYKQKINEIKQNGKNIDDLRSLFWQCWEYGPFIIRKLVLRIFKQIHPDKDDRGDTDTSTNLTKCLTDIKGWLDKAMNNKENQKQFDKNGIRKRNKK